MQGKLTEMEEELLSLLKRHDFVPKSQICTTLNISKTRASYMIRKIRKKFLDDYEGVPYIFISPQGYTVQERVDAMAYETKFRFNMGMGMILNGAYVYKRFKKKSLKGFREIAIEYKPRMLEMKNMM